MTSDTRTPDEIERDIADDRAQLSGTINDLQKKFSVEAIVHDVGAMFRNQGGDLSRSIGRTVSQNPAAVALMGAGLAWLLLAKYRNHGAPHGSDYSAGARQPDPRSDPRVENFDRDALPPSGQSARDGPDREGDRFWFDGAWPTGRHPKGGTRPALAGLGSAPLGQGATAGMAASVRNFSGEVAAAVTGAANAAVDTSLALTDRLLLGTEGFSDDAKARVVAARKTAIAASDAMAATLKRGSQTASNLFEDQPLVVGALAVALGAAIGGALPHSRIEDDSLGATRDRLFADAQAVFLEERAKLAAVLKAAAAEAKGSLQDTRSDLADLLPDGKSAGNVIADYVSESGSRIVESALGEADRQGLGRR